MSAPTDTSLGFWAERVVGLVVIASIIVACFWIAGPLLGVIVWGALIAIGLAPLHRKLAHAVGNRPKLAATLMVLALLALVVVPLSVLPGSFQQAIDGLSNRTNNWTQLSLPPPPSWVSGLPLVGPKLNERWVAMASNSQELLVSVKPYIGPAFQWVAAQGASLGLAILEILFHHPAGIFLTTEGVDISPPQHRGSARRGLRENLLDVAVRTVRSAAQVIGTALIQGVLSGIGFAIAGVPFAALLGVLSFGTAMLQIGTWLVWIPTAVWLSYQGETGWAIFTTVLGIVINVLDNVIKPLLIGRGAGVPLWIIFIGVIGGILTIGLIGIFIGPLIMSVGYSIVTGWLGGDRERA
jgi:predicted PurR-regulated permease PerM